MSYLTTIDPPVTATPARPPLSAGLLDDLLSFDPANMTWTLLSAADHAIPPSARYWHGFTSAGGRLYVHGGLEDSGKAGGVGHGLDAMCGNRVLDEGDFNEQERLQIPCDSSELNP